MCEMNGSSDLLVDWGNSRWKWARSRNGRLSPMIQVGSQGNPAADMASQWADLPAPDRVACVSVADGGTLHELQRWVDQQWGCPLLVAKTQARAGRLVNAYTNPGQLGADRWLAMLGAMNRCASAFAVVDAGTAVTVDVVDHAGNHLGGWILPGRVLMHQALTQNTAAVRPALIDSAAAFGHDTEGCVAGGISAGVLGALQLMRRQLPEACHIFVCGGDGSWICQHLREADHQPDLVLQGLKVWLHNS